MTRSTSFTLQLLAGSALALVIGAGNVHAQMGGDARANDRKIEKQLDDRALTPIRPIRRVGTDSWPDAKPAEQQAAQEKKEEATRAANSRETTGQSARQDTPPNAAQPASQNAQNTPAAANQNASPANAQKQAAEPPKPDASKQAAEPKAAPKPDTKQAAQPEPNKQQAAEPKAEPAKQDTAANDSKEKDKGAASIRLGTDATGKVAINDDQEKQISRVMKRHNVRAIDPGFDVKVGVAVPGSVRLAAVSSDIVDILPQFRGYSYFATRESIVIVEPGDMKVVALIPVAVGSAVVTREPPPASGAKTTVRETSRTVTRSTNAAPDMHAVETAIESDIRQRRAIRETTGVVVESEPRERTVIIERRRGGVFPWWR